MWETSVQPLGWEYPLEEGIVTHSSILAMQQEKPLQREALHTTSREELPLAATREKALAQHSRPSAVKRGKKHCGAFKKVRKTLKISTYPQQK